MYGDGVCGECVVYILHAEVKHELKTVKGRVDGLTDQKMKLEDEVWWAWWLAPPPQGL